jgi:hypothetical protein
LRRVNNAPPNVDPPTPQAIKEQHLEFAQLQIDIRKLHCLSKVCTALPTTIGDRLRGGHKHPDVQPFQNDGRTAAWTSINESVSVHRADHMKCQAPGFAKVGNSVVTQASRTDLLSEPLGFPMFVYGRQHPFARAPGLNLVPKKANKGLHS